MIQQTRDGSRLSVASRWTLQRDAVGSPIRILGINNDITERKQADAERLRLAGQLQHHAAALRKSDERTTYALGAARMGVWELDLVTHRLTWSETMAAILGLAPEQSPTGADGFFALIHPEDRHMVEEALAAAILKRVDLEVEFRLIWPDGTLHWNSGRARVLGDDDGRPVRVPGVGTDISDRKSLEAQFRQAQKMEAVGNSQAAWRTTSTTS